jgi:mono/diheme cytochrome c family protein
MSAVCMKARVLMLAALALPACFVGTDAEAQPAAAPSLLDGVYNEAQALRGQALYYQHCLLCHGETMAGVDKAPALAGPQFGSTWNAAPLAALVARIQTMPPEKPGSLTLAESVDILSYLLWYNGLPLGEQELAAAQDVLARLNFQMPQG